MNTILRPSTLEALGLPNALQVFQNGRPPVNAKEQVDKVFGTQQPRSMVISGGQGIVGLDKTGQFARLLEPFGVNIINLDLVGASNGLSSLSKRMMERLNKEQVAKIMQNVIQMTYDGKSLPSALPLLNPGALLEALPENEELKKAHFAMFRAKFPKIKIRSVTSGLPSSVLGVCIAHPFFPHLYRREFEVVEKKPSAFTHLLLALGLTPIPVSDHWSFVLDVLFCGGMLAALRYHEVSNMPSVALDKHIRMLLGPLFFYAHDVIGVGANGLTMTCLNNLSKRYGPLFEPTAKLRERVAGGNPWYPYNHFRPHVRWRLEGERFEDFKIRMLAPLIQMTALMIKEERTSLSRMNSLPEKTAEFIKGMPAIIRELGPEKAKAMVEKFHELFPPAKESPWYPEVFEQMDMPAWKLLYVNAIIQNKVAVITINREELNGDVMKELDYVLDLLKDRGVENIIVTGDFVLNKNMQGADIRDFFPALMDRDKGYDIAYAWSQVARKLRSFKTSVGFIYTKNCLGGFLELMEHCDYVIAVKGANLGFPEVLISVGPGMGATNILFRRADKRFWNEILYLLLSGEPVKAEDAPYLADFTGSYEEALKMAWAIVTGAAHGLAQRKIEEGPLEGIPSDVSGLPKVGKRTEATRRAIVESAQASCGVSFDEAIKVQARVSAVFMTSTHCRQGKVGKDFDKIMRF